MKVKTFLNADNLNHKSNFLILPVDLRFDPVGVWLPGEDDTDEASVTATISFADFSRSLYKWENSTY